MKRQRILIVEDENIVALDMRMRLESLGYDIAAVVDSGDRAVLAACELLPDLVLLDIKLKGEQDGIEVAQKLLDLTEIPVIFVTAFTDEKTLERAKLSSSYGYIVKPFHERELRIAIELAIYKHQYELSMKRERDLAEEASRLKSEFLANMSHELKTPLNSVIGFTELALSASQSDEQREELTTALSSAKSLLTLINSILDFAKMEAGKLVAVKAPFSLDELLEECLETLVIAARPKSLEVLFRRDPAVPDTLLGDRDMLKHVLLNLLDNAAKFTEIGSIRLSVDLCEAQESRNFEPTIRFEIADTGIGMPKEKIVNAFERFTQLDPSRTRKVGGTGLGLAIVAKSVELMRGRMEVDSEEGRGSSFKLWLPFEVGGSEPLRTSRSRGTVALLGFDSESYLNALGEFARAGLQGRKVESFEEAGDCRYLIVDEHALDLSKLESLGSAASNMIVGTRLGSPLRTRLDLLGIVCLALPIRQSTLVPALFALEASKSYAHKEKTPSLENSDPAPPSSESRQNGILDQEDQLSVFLKVLDQAAERGAFAEIEHAARIAKEGFVKAGNDKASRLAFSALLAARKEDRTVLADVATKLRTLFGVGKDSNTEGVTQ